VPIKKNNKFLGVAGTDLRLNFLQDLAKEVDGHLYNGQGDVLIISYEGMIVASSKDPKTIGQPLHAIFPQSAQAVLKIVQEGKPMVDVSASSGLMRAFGPVKLGRTGKPWCVLLRVSPKIVLAQAQALDAELAQRTHDASYWQVGVGLGVTVLAIAVLWLFSATLVKPLRQAAAFADGVAHGDFSQTLHIQQQDEIGVLAGALQTMVSNLKDMIGQADAKSREAEEEAEHARQAVAEAEKARQEAAMAQRQGMLAAAQKLEGVVERITSASAAALRPGGAVQEGRGSAKPARRRNRDLHGRNERHRAGGGQERLPGGRRFRRGQEQGPGRRRGRASRPWRPSTPCSAIRRTSRPRWTNSASRPRASVRSST